MASNTITKSSPWLIGGPARCGKSALAAMLSDAGSPLAILQVDALMHVYRKSSDPSNNKEKLKFLADYLGRPRYMNPERTKVRHPIDDFSLSLEKLLDSMVFQSGGETSTHLIGVALDQMARLDNRSAWLALDLHPELCFRSYKQDIPNLKLLIMLRDPYEAIAASLYWRTFPRRRAQAKQYLSYAIFLWCLSAQTGAALKREFPNDVYVVSSNALFAGREKLPTEMIAPDLDLQKAFASLFSGKPFFSYDDQNKTFLCPDGNWHELLNADERSQIDHYRDHLWPSLDGQQNRVQNKSNLWTPKYDLNGGLFRLAKSNPLMAKQLADIVYFPTASLRRALANTKLLLQKSSRN